MLLDQLKNALRGGAKKFDPALAGPLEISGSVAITREARIEAVIHGPVQASGPLQLGPACRIEGPVQCRGRLTIEPGAILAGSCHAASLFLEKGARFSGPLRVAPEKEPETRKAR